MILCLSWGVKRTGGGGCVGGGENFRSLLDDSTNNVRSRQVSFGCFVCRLSTINC